MEQIRDTGGELASFQHHHIDIIIPSIAIIIIASIDIIIVIITTSIDIIIARIIFINIVLTND